MISIMIQNDPKWSKVTMHTMHTMHCYALLCTGTSPSFTHRYSASPSPRQSPGSLGPGWLERCSAPKPAEQRCQGATVLLDEQTSTCPWKSFLGPFLDLGRIVIIVILSLLSLAEDRALERSCEVGRQGEVFLPGFPGGKWSRNYGVHTLWWTNIAMENAIYSGFYH